MRKFILLFIAIFLTGCQIYNDIGNIAVISLIAIDYDNENYKTYVKVLATNDDSEDKIYEENCSRLAECFESLSNKLTKRIYLTHMDLLILGNNLVKDNYDHIFKFFLNEETSRNSFSTIIVDKIDDVILESNASDIDSMLDVSFSSNLIAKKKTLTDVIKDILNYELSYIPYFKTQDTLEIEGYKTIYEENKILTKDESIALNIIKNNEENFSIMIDKELYKLEECNTVKTVDNDNKININFSCKYEGNNEKDIKIIEDKISSIIKDFIEKNKDNYFRNLLYKYGRSNNEDINYNINIEITYKKSIGGNIFE